MQIAFHDSPKQKVLYRGMEMLGRFNFPFCTGPFVFVYCPVRVDVILLGFLFPVVQIVRNRISFGREKLTGFYARFRSPLFSNRAYA